MMIGLAIQVSTRDAFPNYQIIGRLYFTLIRISASRKQVLN